MVNSEYFDLTVKTFRDLITDVFTGTDENQKAKLRRIINSFTKIGSSYSKRKLNGQNNNIKPKKLRFSIIHNILPPEILEKMDKQKVVKVIILSVNPRSGSSYLSEILASPPETSYWQEPLRYVLIMNKLNMEVPI